MPYLTLRPTLAAGQLDVSVTIEARTMSLESTGFPVETWTPLATVAMARRTVRADERFAAAQGAAFMETQFHLFYRADMDPDVVDVPATRRLVYAGRVYDIVAAGTLERRLGIELVTIAASGGV